MKYWTWGLALVAAMVVAAFGWHWLAADPGYVMLRLRGTTIETTLVFALVALLALWAVLSLAWRFARWPARLFLRARHAVSRTARTGPARRCARGARAR